VKSRTAFQAMILSSDRAYGGLAENVALMPWHIGVSVLQEPVPVILPLATVALPVNSMKVPFASPKTKSRLIVELSGTRLAGAPIRTPSPVFFADASNPFPEMEPCPLLLFAITQTGPSTENEPTGLVTLQGLETKVTW